MNTSDDNVITDLR